MRQFLALFAVIAGVLAAKVFPAGDLPQLPAYQLAIRILLALGLYAAASEIDLRYARTHGRTIATAITFGVAAKALLIGCLLAALWHEALFLLLGVVVAQIDPLSVAAVQSRAGVSRRAKTILAAWACFDDPVTVIVAVTVVAATAGDGFDLVPLGQAMVVNAFFVAFGWMCWRMVRRHRALTVVLLVALLVTAVWSGAMLGLAVIALFVRPLSGTVISRIARGAYVVAAVVLGVVAAAGIDVLAGVSLGIAAFGAQIVLGWLLTRGLPSADRSYIAFAQQNGVTAIVLALALEPTFSGVVAVIAPAIVVINALHTAGSWLVPRFTQQPAKEKRAAT